MSISPPPTLTLGANFQTLKLNMKNKEIINSKQIFDFKQGCKWSYPGYHVWYKYCIISLVILFIFTENVGIIYIS